MRGLGLAFSVGLFMSQAGSAQPLIERDDRLEMDWANMKLRFYGEAAVSDNTYRSSEQKAWQDGIQYIGSQLKHLRSRHAGPADGHRDSIENEVLKQISSSTYSLNTIYYGNGKVRVQLENELTKALYPSEVAFKLLKPEEAPTRNSGIVIRINGKMRPQAVFRVVNEQGQSVYEAMDVAKEAFDKQFMGAWYQNPSTQEMQGVVGANPAVIEAEAVGNGVIRVNQAVWQKAAGGNENLLQRAKVAIALF